jgi:hypothetical protein
VVWDHVQQNAHPALAEGVHQGGVLLLGADLRIDLVVVLDIVAMGAARRGLEER